MTLSDNFTKAGLTEFGKIKSGHPCPYIRVCRSVNDLCPTQGKYNNDFSCAYSREIAIGASGPPSYNEARDELKTENKITYEIRKNEIRKICAEAPRNSTFEDLLRIKEGGNDPFSEKEV